MKNENLFQSHNGSIGTRIARVQVKTREVFQSHNGSIGTAGEGGAGTGAALFQSHNGSIGTVSLKEYRDHCLASFNPTMVRLVLIKECFIF